MRRNSYTLYQDSARVVIVTGTARTSRNGKTGDMLQVWILARAQDPLATVRAGKDSAICGNCKHAGPLGKRSCYVRLDTAPLGIWRAWKRGNYPQLHKVDYPAVFDGRMVRWGAYGDPSFIPLDIVRWVSFFAAGWTGYTHQWRNLEVADYRAFLMASVDSQAEREQAKSQGWRTFRVRSSGPVDTLEVACPAAEESGHKTTCGKCGLCNGVRYQVDPRKDISILAHGIGARNFKPELIQIGG